MKEFKIRCSAIGQIMTNPRSKADKEAGKLSQTAKTYCENWLKEQLYNRKIEFTSKYTDKGNAVEQASIDFAADKLDWGFAIKNEEYKENEFLTGTCDVNLPKRIIDMKNSWDISTFPLFNELPPDKNNLWQLRGYMALYEKNEAQIVYTLMDLPEELIEQEIQKAAYRNDGELSDEAISEIINTHTYTDVPEDLRIKPFPVITHDEKILQQIYDRVIQCRIYIDSLKKSL